MAKSKDFSANNHLDQVWFSGVHANVVAVITTGLSDITLHWMIEKIIPFSCILTAAP